MNNGATRFECSTTAGCFRSLYRLAKYETQTYICTWKVLYIVGVTLFVYYSEGHFFCPPQTQQILNFVKWFFCWDIQNICTCESIHVYVCVCVHLWTAAIRRRGYFTQNNHAMILSNLSIVLFVTSILIPFTSLFPLSLSFSISLFACWHLQFAVWFDQRVVRPWLSPQALVTPSAQRSADKSNPSAGARTPRRLALSVRPFCGS